MTTGLYLMPRSIIVELYLRSPIRLHGVLLHTFTFTLTLGAREETNDNQNEHCQTPGRYSKPRPREYDSTVLITQPRFSELKINFKKG
jgi:hypothetical protein